MFAQRLSTPQNVEAEAALISCIYVDPNILYEVDIEPEYFYKPENREIVKVIYRLFAEDKPIESLTIKEELRTSNRLEVAGGEGYVDSFPSGEFSPNNAEAYLDLVRDAYVLRNIIDIGTVCIETGYQKGIRVDLAKEKVYSAFSELLDQHEKSKAEVIADIVSKEWDELNFRIKNPDKVGIPTGFGTYDLLCGGLHPGDLVIVAARPGMGKTAWVLKAMLNMAERGVPSLLWEFEMGKSQVAQRLASIISGISLTKIRNGKLTQPEYESVVKAFRHIESLPIYIETDVLATIYDIMVRTRRLKNKHGIQIVAMDHILLAASTSDNLTQELGFISRQMKKLAMDLQIPSLVISQLNRKVEERNDKRPVLSDLRQSGNLEEDADLVCFLYRDEIYNKEAMPGMSEFIIAKHRNGPLATLPLLFQAESTNFVDLE